MEWRTDSTGKIFSSYPYRIEKVRYVYKLYKFVKSGTKTYIMKQLGKFKEFEDATKAAEQDKKQLSLWG